MARELDEVFVSEFDTIDIKELLRCKSSPLYFISKYVMVINCGDRLAPIKINKPTIRMLSRVHKNRNIAIKSSRQVGASTINLAYILWYSLFNRDRTIVIGSHSDYSAKHLLSIIKDMHNRLPNFLKREFVKYNYRDVKFDNGCRILTFSTKCTECQLKGFTISYLYIDNFSFVDSKNINSLSRSILPIILMNKHSKIVLSGINNKQLELLNIDNFVICRIPWYFIPGRDIAWKVATVNMIGWDYWVREFEVDL